MTKEKIKHTHIPANGKNLFVNIHKNTWQMAEYICQSEKITKSELVARAIGLYYRVKVESGVVVELEPEWWNWDAPENMHHENGDRVIPKRCRRDTEVIVMSVDGSKTREQAGNLDWSELPGNVGMSMAARRAMKIVCWKYAF